MRSLPLPKKSKIIIPSVFLVLLVIFRLLLPIHNVFTPDGVYLNTVDAYYFVHFAELFPVTLKSYFVSYPYGAVNAEIYPAIIAGLAHLFNTNDILIAAILPIVFFIGIAASVYAIASWLFNRRTAVIATGLCLIMPGEFMYRTILGAGDRHAIEILLQIVMMITFVGIVKSFKDKRNYEDLAIWSLLAAIIMVAYKMLWPGAIQNLLILGLFILSWFVIKYWRNWRIWGITGFGITALLLLVDKYFIRVNRYFSITGYNSEAIEGQPLLFTQGHFDLSYISMWYGITLFIMLIGIGILIYRYKTDRQPEILLLIVWTMVIMAFTLYARRWGYYLAINVCIITAFVIDYILKVKMNRPALVRVVAAIALIVVIPLTYNAVSTARSDDGFMPAEWRELTSWFKDLNLYPAEYALGAKSENKPEYGVLANWSYGYWIIQAGQMPAYATPGNHKNSNLTPAEINKYQIGYIVTDNVTYGVYDPVIYDYPIIWKSSNNKIQVYKTY